MGVTLKLEGPNISIRIAQHMYFGMAKSQGMYSQSHQQRYW
jgi:hypothetical protein